MRQPNFYDLYPITSVLLLLIGGFFALQAMGTMGAEGFDGGLLGLNQIDSKVTISLGSTRTLEIYRENQYWRLLAAVFLHGGLIHLAFNVWVLLSLGRACEPLVSSPKFFSVYILSGLGGSVASYSWHLRHALRGLQEPRFLEHWYAHAVGASGALVGLIGMLLVYSIRERKSALRAQLVQWIVTLALVTFLAERMGGLRISHAGHLGGFVVGCLLGLTVREHTTSAQVARWKLPAWGLAGLLAICLGFAIWNHGSKNWDWAVLL